MNANINTTAFGNVFRACFTPVKNINMPRQVSLHPAYVPMCGAFDVSPTDEELLNIQPFRDKMNNILPSDSWPAALAEDRVIDIGRKMEVTMVRPIGTENEKLPVLVYL